MLQINENGIFVTADGMPVDREGLPIDGAIDMATGYIMGEANGTMVNFGPNGMPLPDPAESLSPLLQVLSLIHI